jgi:hypothetical protein
LYIEQAEKLTSCVQQIIDFSKMVPGFMQLLQDDQISLLKSGSYGIMLLYAAQCYVPEQNCFVYNNHLINVDHLLSSNSSIPFDEEEKYFIQENLDFIRQIKLFSLSNTETAILSAIILFNPENASLTDQKSVYHNNQKFIELLRMDLENNRNHTSLASSLEKQQMLQQLLNLITVNLRRLNSLHFELIKSFKIKNPNIEFPPLHRELFNVDYYVYCYQQQQLQIQQQNIHFQNSHHSQIHINGIQNSTRYTNNTQTNHYNTLPVIQHKLPTSNMIEMSPSPSSCSSNPPSSTSPHYNNIKVNSTHTPIPSPTAINTSTKSNYNQHQSPSSSSISSSSSNQYINTNTLEFVQTLDEVIMNTCNENANSGTIAVMPTSKSNHNSLQNNASPSSSTTSNSSSSSISPPSYVSLSSTYTSLIKSEQLYSNTNAMSVGVE